jgi:CRP-like cAMP-binding protein
MSLESDANLLSSLPIFELLDREAVRLLAFQAETLDFRAGDVLVKPGDKPEGGLVIVKGQVALEASGQQPAAEPGSAKKLGPGALIGQLALITDITHRATAREIEHTSTLEIRRSSFKKVLREYPECAAKVRAAIASDLLNFTKALEASRAR